MIEHRTFNLDEWENPRRDMAEPAGLIQAESATLFKSSPRTADDRLAQGPQGYDPARGAEVIAWAKAFLDQAAPLANGRWADFEGGEPALADPTQLVGRRVLESALTTIVDLEDSIAAVDAEDKVEAYGNWLGLMRGDLTWSLRGLRLTPTADACALRLRRAPRHC